jgi:hypothetical protein
MQQISLQLPAFLRMLLRMLLRMFIVTDQVTITLLPQNLPLAPHHQLLLVRTIDRHLPLAASLPSP